MSSKREADITDPNSVPESIRLTGGDTAPSDAACEMSEALDCLRLWFAIRTDDGRRRALEGLSRIVEDERR